VSGFLAHNGSVHTLAALLLTGTLSAGVAGLGDLLGGRSAGDRWVRGWTLLWWLVAVSAQVVSPRVGVALGLAAATVGAVRAALTLLRPFRYLIGYLLAALSGAFLWLAPPFFYDALVYHLGLPWSWVANGTFSTIPHHVFSHFPLAGQTVFLLPVALGLPEAAAGLHWVTFVVVLVSLARVAGTLGAGRWRWVAAALFIGCWHAPWIAGVAAVDHLVVLGVVVGVQHLVEPRGAAGLDRIGLGTAWGLALAAKVPAALPVAAVALAALVLSRERRAVLASGALAVASSSFWWVRNLASTGDPVFPLLWGVLGGAGWSADDAARYGALVREGHGGSVVGGVAHLIAPPGGLGWWFLLAVPLALAAMLKRDERGPELRLVGVAVTLGVAGWLVTSQTTRYALPLAALVAVLAVAGLAGLSRTAAAVACACLALGIAHGVASLGGFLVGTLGMDRLLTGAVSAEEWRHRVTIDDPLPAYRACGRLLPPGARVLVVGEGRSFGCPRPHHVSSPYDRQFMQEVVEAAADEAAVAARIREAGWTHLVIGWSELGRLGGPDYRLLRFTDPRAAERWRGFLASCTTPVWREGGSELRQLRAQCGSVPSPPPPGDAAAHPSR
jgi:hypothetical protein